MTCPHKVRDRVRGHPAAQCRLAAAHQGINKVKLYRPAVGDPGAYPRLASALTRPIRWDLIDANYDQVIKYATVIKDGTAATEAVLSRFTRSAYQAMLEIGRAQKTVFVARYLCGLQREIEEGLNVVEAGTAPTR